MLRRVMVLVGFAALLLLPASALAKSPQLKALAVYRTPAGAWVVTGDADYTGLAKTAKGLPDARSRAILTVTLINGNRRITATDTTLFSASANRGRLVHFDIRIPAAKAKALGSPKKIRVRSTLSREQSTSNGRRQPATRQMFNPQPDMILRLGFGTCIDEFTGNQVPCPPAPPAPPVGFEQWVNGNQALICVVFFGPRYSRPTWQNIALSAANGTTVGYVFPAGVSTEIAASGQFTWGSYLDVFVGGYAQILSGPTLSGAIPTSVLSAPVGSATGKATLNVSTAIQGMPTTWSLSPLTPAEAAGVC